MAQTIGISPLTGFQPGDLLIGIDPRSAGIVLEWIGPGAHPGGNKKRGEFKNVRGGGNNEVRVLSVGIRPEVRELLRKFLETKTTIEKIRGKLAGPGMALLANGFDAYRPVFSSTDKRTDDEQCGLRRLIPNRDGAVVLEPRPDGNVKPGAYAACYLRELKNALEPKMKKTAKAKKKPAAGKKKMAKAKKKSAAKKKKTAKAKKKPAAKKKKTAKAKKEPAAKKKTTKKKARR
jgi:hypothetical protein